MAKRSMNRRNSCPRGAKPLAGDREALAGRSHEHDVLFPRHNFEIMHDSLRGSGVTSSMDFAVEVGWNGTGAIEVLPDGRECMPVEFIEGEAAKPCSVEPQIEAEATGRK
jgi:hypothetical protein